MDSTRRLIVIVVLLMSAAMQTTVSAEEQRASAAASSLIELDSTQGVNWLRECPPETAFYRLVRYFSPQKNMAYCGVASSVMVLNALPVPRPEDSAYKPYPFFTQENFFTPEASTVVPATVVAKNGMSLQQLSDLLNAHAGVSAVCTHASEGTLAEFRQVARLSLTHANKFILINYLRKVVGQESGGHVSPLAAYHEAADMFLILDVSQYKYPPVWIPAELLWKAMSEKDAGSHLSRGYVVVGLK